MIKTPRSYWLAITLGGSFGVAVAYAKESSAMSASVKAPPAALVTKAAEYLGRSSSDDATSQCELLYDARAELGARELDLGMAEECKPYRDFRDFWGPHAAVYALYGSLLGLFAGMFANKRLRDSAKYAYWTD